MRPGEQGLYADVTVRPGRTHALVVAADEYEMLDAAWNLPESLADANAFAGWLLDNGVPADNIAFLTGSRRPPPVREELRWQRATFTNLRNALLGMKGKHGDLLLVFWSGHGEMSGADRRLYLPEMRDEHRQNISTEQLLTLLGTSLFGGFPQQAVFVDACAGFRPWPLLGPVVLPDGGASIQRNLYSILSTREGQKSVAGVFGKVLIQELKKERWPPEFPAVLERVRDQFSKTEQTPVSIAFNDRGNRFHWGRALETATEKKKRVLGRNVHLCCDREEVANRFTAVAGDYLQRKKTGPLVCIVYGSEEQKPDSLVKRLMDGLTEKAGEYSGEAFRVSWDRYDDQPIRSSLAEALGVAGDKYTSREFVDRLHELKTLPMIQIQIVIPDLYPTTTAVLRQYLRFWEGWPADKEIPPVFLFLELKGEVAREYSLWERVLAALRRRKAMDRVGAAIHHAKPGGNCVVIRSEELEMVRRGHLHAFCTYHNLEAWGMDSDSLVKKVLGEKQEDSMRNVEAGLRDVIRGLRGTER